MTLSTATKLFLRRVVLCAPGGAAWLSRRHVAALEQEDRERTRAAWNEAASKPKVFGIGLSRTGTSSLTAALREMGLRVEHFKREAGIVGLSDLYLADGATDTPVACQFELLYHLFPNSKFIYTVRDRAAWVDSVRRHFGCERPADVLAGPLHLEGDRADEAAERFHYKWIHDTLYSQHASWEAAYAAHDARVRGFFAANDASRLLEVDIPGGTGWHALAEFLGRAAPPTPFPHRNRGSEDRDASI